MSGDAIKSFVIGGLAIAASFIPGIGPLASSLLLAYGTGRAAAGLASTLVSKQQGMEFNTASTVGALPIVYGKVKLGFFYTDIREDPASTNRDTLYIVGALCSGSVTGLGIEAIEEIYFDDRLAVNAAGTVQPPFTGKLTVTKYLGTSAQNVDATLTAKFPTEWPSTSKGRGVAYLVLKLTFDDKIYPSGIPNVTCIVKGRKVYDPRSPGYAYSTNPALCARDYLTDPDCGAAASAAAEIVEQSFIDAANYCDDLVTISGPGTSQKRFECNGIVDTGQDPVENLRQLLTSCRGNLPYEGGQFRIFIRQASVAESLVLSEANILGGWRFRPAGIKEAPNLARVTYIKVDPSSIAKSYQPDTLQWPRPGASNSYLTEDNGFETALDIELPFTVDKYTAEQIAMVVLKEARKSLPVEVLVHEDALALGVGDTAYLTHPTPGWTNKQFWVMAAKLSMDGTVGLGLQEYDVNAYTLDPQATFPSQPGTNLPNPFSIADPTGLTLAAGDTEAIYDPNGAYTPRILAEWTRPADPFLDYYEIEAKRSTESEYDPYGRPTKDAVLAFISPVNVGETWNVRIRAVNTLGISGNWVSGSIAVSPETRKAPLGQVDFFDDYPGSPARWAENNPGSTTAIATPDAVYGGKVIRIVGGNQINWNKYIPFDPLILYGLRIRVRCVTPSAGPVSTFYCGFKCFDSALAELKTGGTPGSGNQHNVAAYGITYLTGLAWSEFVGFVRGINGGWYSPPAGVLTNSGLNGYVAAKVGDADINAVAFHSDSAVSGSYLLIDLGVGVTKEFVRAKLYLDAGSGVAQYKIQYSDNGSSWTDITFYPSGTTWTPAAAGWNDKYWGRPGAHRYWRIFLNNTPGNGPNVMEVGLLEFNLGGLGDPASTMFPDPNAPGALFPGTAYVQPWFQVVDGGSASIFEVDMIEIPPNAGWAP